MSAHAQFPQADIAFTVATLAERWVCSEGAIRNMLKRGELQSFRIGALIRIPREEVERIECHNIASNDCEGDTQLSGEKMESEDGEGSTPKIGRARNPKHGAYGKLATIHHGPWTDS